VQVRYVKEKFGFDPEKHFVVEEDVQEVFR
jgi:hypothetical protein